MGKTSKIGNTYTSNSQLSPLLASVDTTELYKIEKII
jgi:hypothetical protein